MRIGCLFFPGFALQVELKDNNALTGKPIIIGGSAYELKVVNAASEEAMMQGVKRGMPLHQAYALCPQGIFLPLAEDKYRDAFAHILNLLANHSPVVAMAAENCTFLDVTLEQDEFSFIEEVVEIIKEKTGFYASASIASNKFVAWVASQVTEPGECLVIPDGEERECIQNLPVDLLPASSESLRRLKLFGIYEMGNLAKLSCEAVNFQFGVEGQTLWELANGIDPSRIMPCKMPEELIGEVSFEPPAKDLNIILGRADDLLQKLAGQLKQRWQCCLRLTISIHFSNDHIAQRVFHFKEATSSKEVMLRHLKQYLEKARFTAPLSEMRLTLTGFCPESGRQTLFLNEPLRHREMLASAINWLRQRYGKGVVGRVLTKSNSPLPEDSFSFTEFDI